MYLMLGLLLILMGCWCYVRCMVKTRRQVERENRCIGFRDFLPWLPLVLLMFLGAWVLFGIHSESLPFSA